MVILVKMSAKIIFLMRVMMFQGTIMMFMSVFQVMLMMDNISGATGVPDAGQVGLVKIMVQGILVKMAITSDGECIERFG